MAEENTRTELELREGTAQYWQIELENAEKTEEEWRQRGRIVVERYRDERNVDGIGSADERKFNILWANTETLKGALFAKMAKPDVRRRFPNGNPITREIAKVLERTLSYANDVYNANKPIESALEDYLLPGRGVVWVVYDPVFIKETVEMEEINEFGETVIIEVEQERIGEQRCYFDYVHW